MYICCCKIRANRHASQLRIITIFGIVIMNDEEYIEGKAIYEKHKPHIELLAKVNNSCVFVSVYPSKYLYISSNFALFGFTIPQIDDVYDRSRLFEEYIHPEDLIVFNALKKKAFEYLSTLPFNKIADFKHISEFRVGTPDTKYFRVVCQYKILELERPDSPKVLLGVVDVCPDQDLDAPMKFRLLNYKTGEMIPIYLQEDKDIALTRREMEVLNMVNEGMFSKEISHKLSISIHTVNRHRQNILEKMKVDNVVEAIKYARNWGLLG